MEDLLGGEHCCSNLAWMKAILFASCYQELWFSFFKSKDTVCTSSIVGDWFRTRVLLPVFAYFFVEDDFDLILVGFSGEIGGSNSLPTCLSSHTSYLTKCSVSIRTPCKYPDLSIRYLRDFSISHSGLTLDFLVVGIDDLVYFTAVLVLGVSNLAV